MNSTGYSTKEATRRPPRLPASGLAMCLAGQKGTPSLSAMAQAGGVVDIRVSFLVRQLAQNDSVTPLAHRLPEVDFMPVEKWARRLFGGSLAFSSAMFLLLMGCSFLELSSIAIVPMVGTFLGLGVALVSLFIAPTPLKRMHRQVRVLEPVLQLASWPQLIEVLEHPDIAPEVSRQVRLEMIRRRRLGVVGEPAAPASRLLRG